MLRAMTRLAVALALVALAAPAAAQVGVPNEPATFPPRQVQPFGNQPH